MAFDHYRRRGAGSKDARRASHSNALIPLALVTVLSALLAACAPSSSTRTPQARPPAPPARPQPTITYVAIGASDAFGIGTQDPARDNWPAVLARSLGARVHLINLGIPGETVAQAAGTELPIAISSRPDVVTVWLGVNDFVNSVSVETYRAQLQGMLASLRDRTRAAVFVGNLPDLAQLPAFASSDAAVLRARVLEWNRTIASAAQATGARLVDLYSGWRELAKHPEYIAADGFHPSTLGAARLAGVFADAIRPALPRG